VAQQAVAVTPHQYLEAARRIARRRQWLSNCITLDPIPHQGIGRSHNVTRKRGQQHHPAELAHAAVILPDQTSVMPWFLSGKLRTGLPIAAWIAFNTAGATTQIVGSPTPPQKS
jgi:hypothetical protein